MRTRGKLAGRSLAASVRLAALIVSGGLVAILPTWRCEHARAQEASAGEFPLLFKDDFESGFAKGWQPGDPAAWKVVARDANHVYALVGQSKYQPKVRSPVNISLMEDVNVADFVLEVRLQSSTRDYPHRDLCLFFGYQDPTHFYYVHFGKRADPHANSIFLVNGAPRVSIARTRTDGTNWTDGWHRVKLVRRTQGAGPIEVYFDNMQKPAMTAEDKTFAWGQVGVGSFDDTGNFDDVRLWGRRVVRDDRYEPARP